MGNKLSATQQEEIKKAFDHFDMDKSGEITVDEFQRVLKIKRADVLKLLAESDMNDDGGITFDEFLRLVQKKFLNVYQIIQNEGEKGTTVTLEQMRKAYHKAGMEVTDQELEEYFNSMDRNKDHKVSLEEFIVGCFVNLAIKRRH